MNFYGMLKGDRVYTIYIQTTAGMASMQFADPASAAHPYAAELTAPQAIRTDAPSDLPPARLVVMCALDRSGVLKNLRVLQSDATDFQRKILAALSDWKFSPAFRGNDPVEVNVILGFGVDTN
jgi:TonB family protein